MEALRQQLDELHLHQYGVIVGLGGQAYRKAITVTFAGHPVHVAFPFAGLTIGRMMQARKLALQTGNPGFTIGAQG